MYDKSPNISLFKVKINDKWGYKNRDESIAIVPQYDYVGFFENGLAKVSLNDKWGYIDSTNQTIIPIVYDLIIPSENGLLRVVKDSKWGIIDFNNNIIAPPVYDKVDDFGNNMVNDSLFNKLAKVYKNNKVGFINTKGEEIILVEYEEIGYGLYEANQSSFYRTKLKNKYGYVWGNGVFCKPIFEEAKGFSNAYNGNKRFVDKIGLYTKVKYKGKPYILGENGMLYTYKQFLGEISSIDFENGIKVGK